MQQCICLCGYFVQQFVKLWLHAQQNIVLVLTTYVLLRPLLCASIKTHQVHWDQNCTVAFHDPEESHHLQKLHS